MADHALPALTSTYTNFVSQMSARFNDLAVGLDPAVSTALNPATGNTVPVNFPTGSIRWSSDNNKWQKRTATDWVDLSTNYAINISGTSATATALATSRTINGVGFNGTSNISINLNNSITFNSSGTGAVSGTSFSGSGATTISHNTIGAAPLTGVGTSGTWPISITGTAATATNVNGANQNTFTATQTFNGSTSQVGMVVTDIAETVSLTATAASGTINYDVTTQSVQFHTVAATGNWTVNFRASSGSTLNSILSTGQSITVVLMATQGSTPYFNNAVWVDGGTGGVTTRWQGGAAPTSGNPNSVDIYSYTIVKTANATFSVFASQTRFA